jgi:hypothetical protein
MKGELDRGKESKAKAPAARVCLALETNGLLVLH